MTESIKERRMWWIVALLGAAAVALGAIGAHILGKTIAPRDLEIWNKAVFYHLTHAILCAFCVQTGRYLSARILSAGIICFSGSLYLYALTHFFPLVFVTPIGGVLLILGWLFLPFKK